MKHRTEIIGDQTLILGDCREVMPTLGRFDACVTDPPYGTEDLAGGYGRRQLHSIDGKVGRKIANDKDLTALSDFMRAVNNDCLLIVFYASRKTKQFIQAIGDAEYFGELIWDKRQMGLGYTIRYSHESIAVLQKGTAIRPVKAIDSVIDYSSIERIHPHQKPVGLIRDLVDWVGSAAILDPFMGSGTTLVACQQLGRKGTGIELSEKYFDIACKRVEQAAAQPRLFVEPVQQPEQQVML